MDESPDIPRTGSAARTWLRILAWVIPGISSPALLLGAFVLSYGNPGYETLAGIGLWGTLAAIVIGCAVFDNILHLPRRAEGEIPADPVRKFKGRRFAFFILMQVILTPSIGYATGSACIYLNGI